MTWEEAKDQIAREFGYSDARAFIETEFIYPEQERFLDKAAELYAREVADKSWEAGGERMYQSMSKDSENRAPFKEEFMRQLFPEK